VTAIEYGVLLALILGVILVGVTQTGVNLRNIFDGFGNSLIQGSSGGATSSGPTTLTYQSTSDVGISYDESCFNNFYSACSDEIYNGPATIAYGYFNSTDYASQFPTYNDFTTMQLNINSTDGITSVPGKGGFGTSGTFSPINGSNFTVSSSGWTLAQGSGFTSTNTSQAQSACGADGGTSSVSSNQVSCSIPSFSDYTYAKYFNFKYFAVN
jgi:Flp pilus assembly pilin Flp